MCVCVCVCVCGVLSFFARFEGNQERDFWGIRSKKRTRVSGVVSVK